MIEAIRYGQHAGKLRVVVDMSAPSEFRAFVLENPNRIVVDIEPSSWRITRTKHLNDDMIKAYRSGDLEEGLTRLIFDLRQPAVIKGIFALRKNDFQKDRLVIDLAPTTQNLFSAATSEVFGNRQLKGQPQKSNIVRSDTRRSANLQAESAHPKDTSTLLPTAKPKARQEKVQKRIILIDPGHGGHDPGAVGQGKVYEKNITLSTARILKRQLEDTGRYKVILSRDKDRFIHLRERVNVARKGNADLFISLHADKIDRKGVRGASVYTLSETASDAETARLAEQENKAGIVSGVDLSGESEDVADILLDLAMREKMNESNLLARYIVDSMRRKNIRLLPNSHRSAGFAVLKAPDIPSVLIEIGFLSNPEEAKLLSSAAFQEKAALAILDGIEAYFRKIEALNKI